MTSLRVLGLISGTSMDGIDIAAAELWSDSGAVLLRPLGCTEMPYPQELHARLLAALPPAEIGAGKLCELDTDISRVFAEAAGHGLDTLAGGRAELVASLGQTLYHWVRQDRALGTLQLGRPAWIAEATGLPVITELRVRDVAAGGHGAPLAATLDVLWLSAGRVQPSAALNIGGIANITVLGSSGPLAYDTGPGNALLDCAAAMSTGGAATRDTDGAIAASGTVREDLLEVLLSDPYFRMRPPKSTGKEHFNTEYVNAALARVGTVGDADLLATLTELTAVTVGEACREHGVRKIVVSGGGVGNPVLMAALHRRLAEHGTELVVSDAYGLPAGGKEAYLAALLGYLTWHGLPGNLSGTTGARGPRILGSITPGTGPLRLPPPAEDPPSELRIVTHGHRGISEDQEESCESPTSW